MTEIISEGNVGLMQALNRFEPERGVRFSTYAMWWIKASIQDYILRSWSLVKIGTTAAQRKLFFKLRSAKNKIAALESGDLHPDHVALIAKDLEVSGQDVIEMNRRIVGDRSINVPLSEEGEAGEWQDRLVDDSPSPESLVLELDEKERRLGALTVAMEVLNGRERQIFEARHLAESPETLERHEMQEQNLLSAPLIVRTGAELREDRQEVVLMLHDFTFRSPAEVLAGLTGASTTGTAAMKHKTEEMSAGGGGNQEASVPAQMRGAAMTETARENSGGMHMNVHMDLNDVQYDAFLANDRTLSDSEIVHVDRGGRVRLRIINGASSSQFWIDLGELTGRVVATDGWPVEEVACHRFPLAMAQRLDVLIDLPASGAFPILAQLEGGRRQTGIVLAVKAAPVRHIADESAQMAPPIDHSLEARLVAANPLHARPADIAETITLGGGMKPYAWSMKGEYWPHVTPLMIRSGQRVQIDLVNQTIMAHPIHLHGHAFQVLALDGLPIRGAVRDTILVMPMGRVRIAFDANNPGRWAFHCHNLYHMMSGMMTEFRYEGITV